MTSQVQEGTILLGKYRIEKELGRGAMGYVVAARHEHLGELFAIKLMLPEVLEIPGAAARFLREARACARIKSEHVVRVTDSGEHDGGIPVMVMEYLTGEDLQSILDKRRIFPMHEAISYVLQACEAIAEAHSLGIIHRDLKPSNLFLAQRPNGKPLVKVLDFGISKDLEHQVDAVTKLTATGSIIGTPFYMSPEQMQALPTDHRGDIWSLGVILFELVTGRLPFPGQSYATIAGKVLYEQPPAPSRLHAGVPPEFDAIISRCLEKDPENRYGSVRELMDALEPLLSISVSSDVAIVPPLGNSAEAEAEKETLLDEDNQKTLEQPKPAESLPPPNAAEASKSEADDPANPVTSFYAKRVFGHQSKKTWTSKTQRRRTGTMWAFLFALVSIGLAVFVWLNRAQVASAIKDFMSGRIDAPAVENAPPSSAPDPVESTAPSASASASTAAPPKIAPKSTTRPKSTTSAASSAGPSPSAATPTPTPTPTSTPTSPSSAATPAPSSTAAKSAAPPAAPAPAPVQSPSPASSQGSGGK